MSSDLLNDNLRTRIRHLRNRRIENADEAAAKKLREGQWPDLVSGMPEQIPFAQAEFSGSDQQPAVASNRFIREEPW